jgi:hypothetical protein
MWEHYKATFLRIQAWILLASIALFFSLDHRLAMTAMFFAIMQVGSLVGAMWVPRLKRKFQPHY